MDTDGSICTHYLVLNKQVSYQLILWQYRQTLSPGSDQSNVISVAVDGSINVIKIKSNGSGGTNGTHTNVPIRGDGTGGVCSSVTVSGGVVTAVSVTNAGSGYTFGTVSNAQIVVCRCNKFSRFRIRCNYST